MIYLQITKGFMQFISEKVLEGENVELPVRMGNLQIVGKKINPKLDENGNIMNLAPDWVRTKKLWDSDEQAKKEKQIVYHMNEHTNGIRYKVKWEKKRCGVPNKMMYIFKPTRTNKRKIWKNILSGKEYYIDRKEHQ